MQVLALGPDDDAALDELLRADVEANLFPLALLDRGVSSPPWYGVPDGRGGLLAAMVALPGLVVPWAPEPATAAALGGFLRGRLAPELLVGPRAAVDALLAAWTERAPSAFYDQRVYVADRAPAPAGSGLRRARPGEIGEITRLAWAMEVEDLGRPPRDPDAHGRLVADRVLDGRTWVAERDGALAFVVHVGTRHPLGCQLGGTYVPPRFRGEGLATACVADLTAELLSQHPRVTLHVNEANTPAVRVYEKCGWRRATPFRLAIVPPAVEAGA